ncbi:MAG TPA: potassium/proton antiporter [Myxococcales bacterium]|jgi:cell volume regulation protein A|nr:potassium/proton antiporter [Myxococcales bacterium]
MAEPHAIAGFLLAAGLLIAMAALFSRASERAGLPLALAFLAVGMLAGSEGLGGISFEDYRLTFRVGTTALALILFDGGLHTPVRAFREAIKPAAVLAILGVAGTAGLVALAARALGFEWSHALLLGAVVSSTDAAAVFSVLRVSGIQLRRRVGMVVELESGLNDPMAVLLTMAVTFALTGKGFSAADAALEGVLQLAVGAVGGLGIGWLGRFVLAHAKLAAGGLYPVLTVALALVAFAAPTLLHGSGFLAVYIAGVVLGNGRIPYQGGVAHVHDAIAWLSQVGMFLLLGLLVFPTHLVDVALSGLALGLFLAVAARPLVVGLLLLPFRMPWREVAFISWVGLRGAVPIILATFPVLAGVAGGRRVFDVVFFVVVVNAIIPGWTVRAAARFLKVGGEAPPAPPAVVEIQSTRSLRGDVLSFVIEKASAVAGSQISELPFPEGSAVMLVVRGSDLLPARGSTRLLAGDHVHVFCLPQDRGFLELMFGRAEEG